MATNIKANLKPDFKSHSREINPKANAFWRDLMGTLWNDPDTKTTHGIMSAELIADHMGIATETASAFLWQCVEAGLTDRQGGGFVV